MELASASAMEVASASAVEVGWKISSAVLKIQSTGRATSSSSSSVLFLEAGGLVVFFLVVEEASSQVMVTASVAVCRSVWILGIPVSLVALSMPTSEAGSR